MPTLRYISADDWAAVYIDDDLVYQDHQIRTVDWLDLLQGGPYEVEDYNDRGYDVIDMIGEFPNHWHSVVVDE